MLGRNVGAHFILGFRGPELPGWLLDFERAFGLGGVILFDYDVQTKTYRNNIESPEQLRKLCARIESLSSRPLVFVDQEGGKVRRLKDSLGFKPLPSAARFSQLPSHERQHVANDSFLEMHSIGLHFNLAPVVDLNLNPDNPDIGAIERSYGRESAVVRENVGIVDAAARKANIGLCLKHYPGLGGATKNSHLELTDLSDTISDEQLGLFTTLAPKTSGNAILVSHGIVRQWEPETPVSVSKVAIGALREKLPDTLLVSDDLQMQGLQKKLSTKQATIKALAAGLDQVIIGNNLMDEQLAAQDIAQELAQAALASTALGALLDRSYARIQERKRSFNARR